MNVILTILRRIIETLPILLAVATVVFVLARIVPGDPALVILGDQASEESLAAIRARLGLDQPLHVQYLTFIADVFRGDLGTSLATGRTVWQEVGSVLPYTLELTAAAILIGTLAGIPLGMMAAVHRNAVPDYALRVLSLAGLSFPAFVSGILMILAFAVHFRFFPVIGVAEGSGFGARLHALTLPALNLGLIMVAYVTRVTRSAMLNVLSEDYVRTARAKGVPRRRLLWRHALRNALIPIVTVIGLYFGTLIGNSVLTEIVFNRPGLGKLILGALTTRDYTLLQGLMIVFAFCVVLVNALSDITYRLIDPRVKPR